MSIFENLLISLYPNNSRVPGVRFIDWMNLSEIFDWEVERLSIKTGPKSNPITSLSGGNQQKVMIGRALALHPKILVLNDPARGIDVDTKRDLYKHLRDFANEGNSVIYMSSELEEFIGFCSRVAVFRNGSIFKTFVDHEVEPVGILEGMFGRIEGNSSTIDDNTEEAPLSTHGSSSGKTLPQRQSTIGFSPFAENSSNPDSVTGKEIERIKIIDYDKSPVTKQDISKEMKISYFD